MSRRQVSPLAANLREAMTEAGISIARLARALETSERNVARWRAGDSEPNFAMRLQLSHELGYGSDVSWLYEPVKEAA